MYTSEQVKLLIYPIRLRKLKKLSDVNLRSKFTKFKQIFM